MGMKMVGGTGLFCAPYRSVETDQSQPDNDYDTPRLFYLLLRREML